MPVGAVDGLLHAREAEVVHELIRASEHRAATSVGISVWAEEVDLLIVVLVPVLAAHVGHRQNRTRSDSLLYAKAVLGARREFVVESIPVTPAGRIGKAAAVMTLPLVRSCPGLERDTPLSVGFESPGGFVAPLYISLP